MRGRNMVSRWLAAPTVGGYNGGILTACCSRGRRPRQEHRGDAGTKRVDYE